MNNDRGETGKKEIHVTNCRLQPETLILNCFATIDFV